MTGKMASANTVLRYFIAFFGIFLVVSTCKCIIVQYFKFHVRSLLWHIICDLRTALGVTMAEIIGSIPNPYFTAYMVHSFYSIGYVVWIAWKLVIDRYHFSR